MTPEPQRNSTTVGDIAADTSTVHELRPVDNLKVCSSCLVHNSGADKFCTACGTPLETGPAEIAPPAEAATPAAATTATGSAAEEATVVAPAGAHAQAT